MEEVEQRGRILHTLRSRYESWMRYRAQWNSMGEPWSATAAQLFDHEVGFLGAVLGAIEEQAPSGLRIFEFLDGVASAHRRAIPLSEQTHEEVWQHLVGRRSEWKDESRRPRGFLEQFDAILQDPQARQELENLMIRPCANTEPNRYVLEDKLLAERLRDVPPSERRVLDRGVSTGETSLKLQERLGGTVIAMDRAPISEAAVQLTPLMLLQGYKEHPRLHPSAVVQFRQGDIGEDVTGLDGRVVLIRDASVLEHLDPDTRQRAVRTAFRLAGTRQGGLWYHTTSGSASRVTLLSRYIFHVTGPDSGDWTLSHAGYLLQLGGKDRSVQLSDDELLQHEEAISRRVLAIRAAALSRSTLLDASSRILDGMGRVVPSARTALATAIIPQTHPHRAILTMMLGDILLISPWTSLDEYRGNVYREQGILAQHELAWPFAERKLDLEELLGEPQSLLEAGLEECGALLSATRQADKDVVWASRLSPSDWQRSIDGIQTQP